MARESLKELGPATLSWSAILAGSFVALGAMVMFGWLGIAIGLSAAAGSPEASGIWLTVWMFVAPILALFLGGLVAGRFSGVTNRQGGAMHGAVTWGFSTIVGAVVAWMLFATVLGGVMNLGGVAAQTTGAVLGAAGQAGPGTMQALGLDAQDLLGPVNQDRAQRGLPPLQAENLQAALQDAASRSLQEGQVNREILVSSLQANTQVSRPEAERIATRVEARIGQVGQDVGAVAQTAYEAITASAWFAFVSSLLSLAAAAGAGTLAVSRTQKEPLYARPRTPIVGPGGEVYP